MYYINSTPTDNGNYGNPQSNQYADSIAIPEELLDDYIACRGFAVFTVEDDTVTAVDVNQDALDAYLAEHPDVPDEPSDEPSAEDVTLELLADHEERLCMIELTM